MPLAVVWSEHSWIDVVVDVAVVVVVDVVVVDCKTVGVEKWRIGQW